MGEEIALTRPDQLKLYEPQKLNGFDHEPQEPKTPNEWFVQRYPWAYENHGSPFLELVQPIDQFTVQVLPVSLNFDFFASVLGGRKDLGHHIIYFEPEMQWYFKDSDQIYKTTTAEKLANLYRALMIKCAEEMPGNVHKLNLFQEFRSDRTAKAVVQRAKSVLACSPDYFSARSPHQRIRGPELAERLMRSLCESMLEKNEGSYLTVTQAYKYFSQLAQQRQIGSVKRSMFRAEMQDLVRDFYGVGLRRDVPNELGKQQEAWRGVRLIEAETVVG